MRPFPTLLWLSVALALSIALGIAGARVVWQSEYQQVEIAVNLEDLYQLGDGRPHDPLVPFMRGLQGQKLRALTVSPTAIRELRARFTRLPPEGALLDLTELRRWRQRGWAVYWRLDDWITERRFDPYLEGLFDVAPRGLLLAHPYALPAQSENPFLKHLRSQDRRTLVGLVEFVDPWPAVRLHKLGYRDFVRTHLLKAEERRAMSRREARNRYLQAITERNVRLVELRAISTDQLMGDLAALREGIRETRLSLGMPEAPRSFSVAPWALGMLWLGALGLFILAASRELALSPRRLMPIWAVLGLAGLAGFLGVSSGTGIARESLREGLAWIIAAGGPVAGFALLSRWGLGREGLRRIQAWAALGSGGALKMMGPLRGLVALLALSMVSVLVGIAASSTLSDVPHFIGLESFRGVKLALALPVVGVAVLGVRHLSSRSLRMGDVLVWSALVLLIAFVLLRSDNVPQWLVPGFEQKLRDWLEAGLGVRPRFKEFLIGHPLLMVWGYLGADRRRPWALALLSAGFIGQVSIVNSHVHLHAPLLVTLTRTAHGLWAGAILGALIIGAGELLRRYGLFDFSLRDG